MASNNAMTASGDSNTLSGLAIGGSSLSLGNGVLPTSSQAVAAATAAPAGLGLTSLAGLSSPTMSGGSGPGGGGGGGAGGSSGAADSQAVMNDKVQALAGSVYEEFERMIGRYDRDVVKDLMPLIVNVLESLDFAYTESQEMEVENELLKEDNEQLVTQYEREKQLRKSAEQRLLEMEDSCEVERKEASVKLGSLTSIVKMFELKAKNSQDQIARLEDKENEMKKEFSKLHDRYTELFKTHIDYLERTKAVLGSERLEQLQQGGPGVLRSRIPSMVLGQLNRSSGPVSFGYSELENNNQQASIISADIGAQTTPGIERPFTSIRNELMNRTGGANDPKNEPIRGGWVDGLKRPEADLEVEDAEDQASSSTRVHPISPSVMTKSQTRNETRTGNNLYQELSFQDSEALGDVDEGADITVSDNYFGMGKEVENLISENNELLATKNALNIVKDDLIAKVDELTGEHEILREEIRSLQDVRTKLQRRVQELEDDVKRLKQESDLRQNKPPEEDEDVPMAQRKRFTRVEMARVLMERNQYKEKFMELQEAVRWTEMIRVAKFEAPSVSGAASSLAKKSGNPKGMIWRFFDSLFSSSDRDPTSPVYAKFRGGGDNGSEDVGPALSTMRARSSAERRSRAAIDFFDGETIGASGSGAAATRSPPPPPSPATASGSSERREQFKQVRAHVKKDNGRMQAYGWSLPTSANRPEGPADGSSGKLAAVEDRAIGGDAGPVPVPVYCRPLMEKEPGMKIWCAAGVNLSGGRTRDGGDVVGASVFYHDDGDGNASAGGEARDPVARLEKELAEGRRLVADEESRVEREGGSHVWICTSTHAVSKVTVIDANSPADVLETFQVCSSHLLCIASVPGAKEGDYSVDEELDRLAVDGPEAHGDVGLAREVEADGDVHGGGIGTITFVSCGNQEAAAAAADATGHGVGGGCDPEPFPRLTKQTASEVGFAAKVALNRTLDVYDLQDLGAGAGDLDPHATLPFISHNTLNMTRDFIECTKDANRGDAVSEDTDGVHRRFKEAQGQGPEQAESRDKNVIAMSELEMMSSVLPTMWLGSQSGSIYVHSAVAQWKRCIHSIRLQDSVLCIVHVKGRVMAALANGTIAIFHRSPDDGQWDLRNYHLLDLRGGPANVGNHSIRCMVQVHGKVWCGFRNRVFVINPFTMRVESTLDAHPRRESQVRQMAWTGDGVWVSIRLDSTLRLYHAHTLDHLQDVDVEPYVSKMLGTGKLGFSFVRITSLLISCNRLWMGTGNGVIISVPLLAKPQQEADPAVDVAAKGRVKVYADSYSGRLTMETYVPYCSMAQAQLSFHGHRDSVKFFVAVKGHGGLSALSSKQGSPAKVAQQGTDGKAPQDSMLVMSGGEGYIDFRLVDDGSDQDLDSHIMVWRVDEARASGLDLPDQPEPTAVDNADSSSLRASDSPDGSVVDLGPSPGSGLQTDIDSMETESLGDEGADNNLEVPAPAGNDHIESSPVEIGRDALAEQEKSLPSSRVSSVEPEPKEDFTQHFTS